MKRRLSAFISLWFVAGTCFAQSNNFNIADYKYRTDGFKAFSFYGSSAGTASTGNSNSKNFRLMPNLAYRYRYSTDARQFNLDFNPSLNLGTESSKPPAIPGIPMPSQKTTSTGFSGLGSLSVLTRDFKPSYFIEYGGDVTFNVGTSSGKQLSQSNSSSRTQYSLSPQIGIGRGRLEYVSDAQMAMFILNDLIKDGKIKKDIPAETANAFARLITDINNKRIFDFRRRRMYELRKIDSFLKASNLITSCDIDTYNIINDNWSFAIQPQAIDAYTAYQNVQPGAGTGLEIGTTNYLSDREDMDGRFGQVERYSGVQYFVRLNPFIQGNSDRTKTDSTNLKNSVRSRGADLSIGIEQETPVSLQWQMKRFASVNLGFSKGTSDSYGTKSSSSGNNVGLEGGMGIGYYPNSRTTLQATGSIALSKGLKTNTTSASPVVVSPFVQLNANYFLNYMSRISGYVLMNYVSKPAAFAKGGFNCNYYLRYVAYIF